MKWKEFSKNESEAKYLDFADDPSLIKYNEDNDYKEIRNLIMYAFTETLKQIGVSKEKLNSYYRVYQFDCLFGKAIYSIFTNGKYLMKERDASNDDIWRYIQLNIIPDIIYYRWGENCDLRLYKQSNRIYLKTLWWYYHLSFNHSLDYTYELLSRNVNSSDTIVALTERSGTKGYMIDLYRKIMYAKTINSFGQQEFRIMMKLTNAKVKIINPYLSIGGIDGYVDELIDSTKGAINAK